jgi:3-oxoacyl-[acyl-carrier protein] reductase
MTMTDGSTQLVAQTRVALVTGATRGIGRAIAMTLGQAGHTVIGTATTEAGAQSIKDYLAAEKIAGTGLVLDVNDAAASDRLLDEIAERFGTVGILVNNAGITRDNLAMRMKDEEWDAVLQTNLTAVFRLSRGVLRGMLKARWGRIISITSVVGLSGNPGQVNYAAAKAGVAGMSRALAREVASRGITVNAVAPGFIDTDMTKSLSDEQIKTLTSQIPAQRLGTPQDVAHAVGFLASEGAGYVNGVTLSVNGGMVMS